MTIHTVDVQIETPYTSEAQPEPLRQAAEATLQQGGLQEPLELAVVVTGDETLRRLNQRYRGVDAPTDVLAFPHESKSATPALSAFVNAPGLPRYLGDVLISLPRARAQAAQARHDLTAELQLLVIHGVLHLLGCGDETEPERTRMWQAQRDVLDQLDINVDLPD